MRLIMKAHTTNRGNVNCINIYLIFIYNYFSEINGIRCSYWNEMGLKTYDGVHVM